jgi:deazaflavin-dependent oxidoreductase (nitroreductase family)
VSSVADLADAEFCYLTTTGRSSGDLHRIEIWFVAHADGAYLLSNSADADWYRNLVAEPRVVLEIAGERRDTTARPVDATAPANPTVRPAMVAKYQPGYAQEDLREWSETASLVRVDWPA